MTKKRTGLRAKLVDEISMTNLKSGGTLRVANNLMEKMGTPAFVALWWSVKGEIIGIMPRDEKAKDAYRLKQGDRMSCSEVTCKKFLDICNLTSGKQYRISARYDETRKMVIAPLRAPKLPPPPPPASNEIEAMIRIAVKEILIERGLLQ